jgi:hypothetical protein
VLDRPIAAEDPRAPGHAIQESTMDPLVFLLALVALGLIAYLGGDADRDRVRAYEHPTDDELPSTFRV